MGVSLSSESKSMGIIWRTNVVNGRVIKVMKMVAKDIFE